MSPVLEADRVLASARKRFQRRQWARRLLVARMPIVIALVVVAVGGLVWAIFFSSLLDVRSVAVRGEHILRESDIAKAAGVEPGTPLARVDLGEIQRQVEALPAVRSAEVSRSWPHTIEITVEERTAVAAVRINGAVWALDADGVRFSQIVAVPAGLPEIHAGGGTDRAALREGAAVVAALPARLARKVGYVDVRSMDDITLHMNSGALVRWGSSSDIEAKAKVLALLMRQDASVYDVSSPGQPTIKP